MLFFAVLQRCLTLTMIKKYLPLLVLSIALGSCNNKTKKEAVTDLEVARAFVRNILDNDLQQAEQYLFKDEKNLQLYDRFKQNYQALDKTVLEKYKAADIVVNDFSKANDSVSIFNYSTSYNRTDTTILKLIRIENKWLVDMKYTFP
jgi:hypothetical protein